MLEIGDTVDDFTRSDHQGNHWAWSAQRGHPLVMFFYPKANTPGCTTEACAFRDLSADFAARDVRLVGVSADQMRAQSNFGAPSMGDS